MTKDEFEQMYAEKSGVSVEWLHEHDRIGLPCSCGEGGCEGWQMAHLTKRALNFAVCSAEFHSLLFSEGESLCLVCQTQLSQ
jgi:hypothetical protein